MAPRKTKKTQDDAGQADPIPGEKRKSAYRNEPNEHYDANMARVFSERMFILKATESGEYGDLAMSFSIQGNSESAYTVKIANKIKCNCQSAVSHCFDQIQALDFLLLTHLPAVPWWNMQAHSL